MYLQSYIFRATSTLHHLSESREMQTTLQDLPYEQVQVALIYGVRDLKHCCSSYRGLTCIGSQGTTVGRIREVLDKLSGLCDTVAIALVQDTPLDTIFEGLQKCPFSAVLSDMQRCGWNDWRNALAMHVPGGYLRSLREEDLNTKSLSATKCVAAYSSAEKYTLLQSYADRQAVGYPSGADIFRTRDVSWHDMCNVSVRYKSVEPGYCEIFEEHDIPGYSSAIFNYWEQVAKRSLSVSASAASAV